ncbi:hypothetical protein ACMZOO_15825 [Catenovulum sp. SX2]|uniref:hypothetical protein n=1 Tax=Catenovulum sp. SX2 TaxID=3398614 RepID=UPI003F854B5D
MARYWLKCMMLVVLVTHTSAYALDYVHYQLNTEIRPGEKPFLLTMLEKALEHTRPDYGDYLLNPMLTTENFPRTRLIKLVQQGELSIIWSVPNPKLEQELQAIYIPLYKGTQGFRIFLIRQNEQAKFNKISNLSQLKALIAGQGYGWSDVAVLEHNNFKVLQGNPDSLVRMLESNRFDFYPRGLHEPWKELKPDRQIKVESTIALHYPLPIYFFVSKENRRLQQRLNIGLDALFDNGEFDRLFYNHPRYKEILQKANLANRKIYKLENPTLSAQSKAILQEKKYWLDTSVIYK